MKSLVFKLVHIFPILREKIGRYLNTPLYSLIQYEVESNFHKYLKLSTQQVKKIVIVGAYLGLELPRLLKKYPNAFFYAFEPNAEYFTELSKKYNSNPRVELMNIAISSNEGKKLFNEGSKPGTGSLLELSTFAIETYGVNSTGSYEVETASLDKLFCGPNLDEIEIDLLWIDVQGAEMLVFQGASKCLESVKAVFVEVSVTSPIAKEGAMMADVTELLSHQSFTIVGLGLDNENLTGNAFYIKQK